MLFQNERIWGGGFIKTGIIIHVNIFGRTILDKSPWKVHGFCGVEHCLCCIIYLLPLGDCTHFSFTLMLLLICRIVQIISIYTKQTLNASFCLSRTVSIAAGYL